MPLVAQGPGPPNVPLPQVPTEHMGELTLAREAANQNAERAPNQQRGDGVR